MTNRTKLPNPTAAERRLAKRLRADHISEMSVGWYEPITTVRFRIDHLDATAAERRVLAGMRERLATPAN